MVKFEVEIVYRNIVVYMFDRYFLGMNWRNQFYIDLVFFFVFRLVFYIFNFVVELVEWILVNNYNVFDVLYYLEDFIIVSFY